MPNYQLVVYVPDSHVDSVKDALFKAGAGHYGTYDRCCWQVKGTGQFRPLEGSNPHTGETGRVTAIDEVRIEMLVRHENVDAVVDALRQSHPFEVPAFHLIQHAQADT